MSKLTPEINSPFDSWATNASESMIVTSEFNMAELAKLMESLTTEQRKERKPHEVFGSIPCGWPVVAPKHLSPTTKQWVPPSDPFIEFESKDEAWAKKLGFGHEEDRKVIYAIYPARLSMLSV
jgi:hypothetical protein